MKNYNSVVRGCPWMQNRMGVISETGYPLDYVTAASFFQKAAEQGFYIAQRNLANYYYYGYGIEKDYSKAVFWYSKAAEQGDVIAQYYLGWCFEHGQGVKKNYSVSKDWYLEALKNGHDSAKTAIERIDKRLTKRNIKQYIQNGYSSKELEELEFEAYEGDWDNYWNID